MPAQMTAKIPIVQSKSDHFASKILSNVRLETNFFAISRIIAKIKIANAAAEKSLSDKESPGRGIVNKYFAEKKWVNIFACILD